MEKFKDSEPSVVQRMQESYQFVKDEKLRSEYMNNLMIRSFLQQ
jgi:hypothetical protein